MFSLIKKVPMIVIIVITTSILSACGTTVIETMAGQPTGGDYALNNQNQLFWNAARAVGWHQPRQSTEIENLLIRNIRYNNPNHKSWVYIYANNGSIKAAFEVRGKCTATDSSATSLFHAQPHAGNNDTSGGTNFGGSDQTGVPVDSPQLDGSYGGNEPGIFCFLNKPGSPLVTFNGDYIMSDTYIPLKQAPELVISNK